MSARQSKITKVVHNRTVRRVFFWLLPIAVNYIMKRLTQSQQPPMRKYVKNKAK